MATKSQFIHSIQDAYKSGAAYLTFGAAMFEDHPISDLQVTIPFKMLNRHGLVAGATGTGKTKTIQYIAGELSKEGIPVLLMDIKGDISGIAQPGVASQKIEERQGQMGFSFHPQGHPVEFLTLSQEKGVSLKATVSEFGPVLFSRMLGLSEAQSGVMALLFRYSEQNRLPLLDLQDAKKVLQYLTNEGKEEIEKEYGLISVQSASAVIRKIIELEQQGADHFFGEKSFEVNDLLRVNAQGEGIISIMRLSDIQDRPKLFSTFMLALLGEIYATFPEEGDLERPKLVIFIDEAHLVFEEASAPLKNLLQMIVKMIRSKGVGLFFCTQSPTDIPADILGQLGLKIQHALRAFTAADRKNIKKIAENYPETEFYQTDQLLTNLGTGQALVTTLNDQGIPTPIVQTMICTPDSRMDILTDGEIDAIVRQSTLKAKYDQAVDRDSAYKILSEKMERLQKEGTPGKANEKSTLEMVMESSAAKQIGRSILREVIKSLLALLGLGKRANRR